MKLLVIEDGAVVRECVLLEGNCAIGRLDEQGADPAPDIDLSEQDPEQRLSRQHAMLKREGASVIVFDLGSANGTYVNGTQLEPNSPCELKDGDQITLAATFLRFEAS